MHPNSRSRIPTSRGSALLAVLGLSAAALVLLAGTLRWTSNNALMIDRSVRYHDAVLAAEAATEKALTELSVDFARLGPAATAAKVPIYKTRLPKTQEHPRWGRYKFKNGHGDEGEILVEMVSPWGLSPLISQYRGLSGYAATYRVLAQAQDLDARQPLIGGVQQDVQIALVPIFQFAIFYNLDLEVNPGAKMDISGRVHCNYNIYAQPAAPLTFLGDVTAAGQIILNKKPGDPVSRTVSTTTFQGEHDAGVMTLHLPIGTTNTPQAVRQIVEIPPVNESPNSELGRQRFYNLADVVILVKDSGVEVRGGGLGNGNGMNIHWSSVSNWIRTGVSFYDQREQKTMQVTELDLDKFKTWNAQPTNALRNALGRDINSIYIADLRTMASGQLPGVRLVNGSVLPPLGLTVATPDPLYVKGDFNASGSSLGTHNTSNTKPAALIADSITLLSGSWNDANSTKSISSRVASATTVNAAFLAGIVETVSGHYSGGVENFPRFLENWSGKKLTYNGSMIVLYQSRFATGYWPGTGTVYNPPNRDWAFDTNFLNPDKLPPLCPSVRAVIRGQYALVAANP